MTVMIATNSRPGEGFVAPKPQNVTYRGSERAADFGAPSAPRTCGCIPCEAVDRRLGGGHLGAADGDAHDPQEQLERKVHRGFFARGSGPAVLNPGGSTNEGRRDGAGLRCRVGNAGHRSVELPIGRACLLHSCGYPSGQLPGFGVRPPRGRSRSSRCPRRPCSARPRDGDGRAACRRRCR